MSFIRKTGRTKTMYFPKKASTAINDGDMAIFDGSGYVTVATSSSTQLLGVHRQTWASSDATTVLTPVQVPIEIGVEWEALTASAVAADVGAQVDLTDQVTVNRGGTSHKVVTITKFISATSVYVVLNSSYFTKNGA